MAGELDRRALEEAGWRQGVVIDRGALEEVLGTLRANGSREPAPFDELIGVVITHSCDLVHKSLEAEPWVEIAIGRRIASLSSSCVKNRNPRRIHLSFIESGSVVHYEFLSANIVRMPRDRLCHWAPDTERRIHEADLDVLRKWLALRYSRAAHPDAFSSCFNNDKKVREKTNRLLREVSDEVDTAFVRLSVDQDDEEKFNLEILLVTYDALTGEQHQKIARVARELEHLIAERCEQFASVGVEFRSMFDVTVGEARDYVEWVMDHLSD